MTASSHRLHPAPLTQAAFAPFGTVIAWPEDANARPINAGTSLRFDLLPDLGLTSQGGTPCLALFRAQARVFPLPILDLERHQCGAQLFIPLGRLRFVVVVAPATAHPRRAELRAFVTDGSQGVLLAPGTWHHALLAIDAGDFVVIERRGAAEDCDIARLAHGVHAVYDAHSIHLD